MSLPTRRVGHRLGSPSDQPRDEGLDRRGVPHPAAHVAAGVLRHRLLGLRGAEKRPQGPYEEGPAVDSEPGDLPQRVPRHAFDVHVRRVFAGGVQERLLRLGQRVQSLGDRHGALHLGVLREQDLRVPGHVHHAPEEQP